MTGFREPSFKERQDAAAKAKQAALEKLRARLRPGEPAFVQQQADRVSRATEQPAAKEARAAEKAQKKPRDAEPRERAARAAAEQAASDAAGQKTRKVARQADQKPTRDKRHAARKARSK
jgi:hypothetical protein